jgi:hypothetical protein
MHTSKKVRPAGVCTICGEFAADVGQLNLQCFRVRDSVQCTGVFGSALNTGDWEECPKCGATGKADGETCPDCNGEGWLYTKPRV